MKLVPGQKVVAGGIEYTYDIDEHGRDTLKTYDEEFKVWGTLIFSEEDTDAEVKLIEALSKEYISKMTQ
ncbi:hypothetical protein MKZ15_06230 [Paenibacillus sp. FSL R7-0216]|uniref:hypothetical protein n=1 Tax=Paenibacillus sp. FSL R7-0216 TaxID=2921677 RepID=UPI0030D85DDD